MLSIDTTLLQSKKNLLAFSAGVDSSALFFLLIQHNIPFDIAIVDYAVRGQSKKEIEHAQMLAKQYDLQYFTATAPKFESHFEANARNFRYDFFETLIKEYGYANLLTAHQLNDQLEWFLMRLTKGAGISELIGLEPVSQRDGYTLIRPLLGYSKEELLSYLKENQYPYFIDESNSNERYERNRFRKRFSDPLITQYKEGIKRSFAYIRQDKETLESTYEIIFREKKLTIVKLYNDTMKAKAADMLLKEFSYLLSASQRQQIEKEKSLVIGGEWAVEERDNLLFIAPYLTMNMPKDFKERCRIRNIPAKIRPYLFQEKVNLHKLP